MHVCNGQIGIQNALAWQSTISCAIVIQYTLWNSHISMDSWTLYSADTGLIQSCCCRIYFLCQGERLLLYCCSSIKFCLFCKSLGNSGHESLLLTAQILVQTFGWLFKTPAWSPSMLPIKETTISLRIIASTYRTCISYRAAPLR